jgi:uncharacterized protein YegP (UPF0339 family)
MEFEIYPEHGSLLTNTDTQWRWRLWSNNRKIIADSGEGYNNHADCVAGIHLVMDADRSTPISDHQPRNALAAVMGSYFAGLPPQGLLSGSSAASFGLSPPSQGNALTLASQAGSGIKKLVR